MEMAGDIRYQKGVNLSNALEALSDGRDVHFLKVRGLKQTTEKTTSSSVLQPVICGYHQKNLSTTDATSAWDWHNSKFTRQEVGKNHHPQGKNAGVRRELRS